MDADQAVEIIEGRVALRRMVRFVNLLATGYLAGWSPNKGKQRKDTMSYWGDLGLIRGL